MADDMNLVPKSETVESLIAQQHELPAEWRFQSEKGNRAMAIAKEMAAVKHGLYAAIPIVCKAHACPYAATCPLLQMDMAPLGERCPIEISKILKGFETYSRELQIDEDNIVDMTLLKDLLDIEVQIDRANKKLANDADFIQDVVVTISEHGDEITQPQIHKAVDFKDKLIKQKQNILQLLHSTRKDKAGDKMTITLDPSTYAAQLMAEAAKQRQNVIDVTPDEDDE